MPTAPLFPEINVSIPLGVPFTYTFSQDICRNYFEHQFGPALLISLFGSVDGVKPVIFTGDSINPIVVPPGMSLSVNGTLSGAPTTAGLFFVVSGIKTAPAINPPPPALSSYVYLGSVFVPGNSSGARYRPIFG